MPLFKPNSLTEANVRNPCPYSLAIGVMIGLFLGAGLWTLGPVIGIVAGIAGFLLGFVIMMWVWGPNGPGANWYRRRSGA